MTALELSVASSAADPSALVGLSAPGNPILDALLSSAVIGSTSADGGAFTLVLDTMEIVFRIGCPNDTAMNDALRTANVISVDRTSEPPLAKFLIDI